MPDLVLLGVQVLLRAVTDGLADARARMAARRCRRSPPGSRPGPARIWNAGRPPYWRYSCRISGVLANRFGRMISTTSVAVSSVKYSISSCLVFRQVK